MKNPFLQLFFGIDTLVALASYTALTIVLNAHPSIFILFLSLMFAYLPDFDLFIFFLFRRKFNWKSHWVIAHHPIIIIPLTSVLAYFIATICQIDKLYLISLFLIDVLAHFLHDSMHPIGFHWFSPFSWKRFVFQHGRFVAADPAAWEIRQKQLGAKNKFGTELALRLEEISSFQIIIVFLLLLIVLSLFKREF